MCGLEMGLVCLHSQRGKALRGSFVAQVKAAWCSWSASGWGLRCPGSESASISPLPAGILGQVHFSNLELILPSQDLLLLLGVGGIGALGQDYFEDLNYLGI